MPSHDPGRSCQVCGAEFEAVWKSRVTCSPRCWRWAKAHPGTRAPDVWPRRGRRPIYDIDLTERMCPQCGQAFVPLRKAGGIATEVCSKSCANLRRHNVPPGGHPTSHNARRQRLEGSRPGLTRRQRFLLLREWVAAGRLCVYCGDAGGTIDHVVPLHLGGTNFPDNLVPACLPCNTSKGRRTLAEWGGRRGHPLSGVWAAVSSEAGFGDVLRGALQEASAAEPGASR